VLYIVCENEILHFGQTCYREPHSTSKFQISESDLRLMELACSQLIVPDNMKIIVIYRLYADASFQDEIAEANCSAYNGLRERDKCEQFVGKGTLVYQKAQSTSKVTTCISTTYNYISGSRPKRWKTIPVHFER
jgi:hypothetical protein